MLNELLGKPAPTATGKKGEKLFSWNYRYPRPIAHIPYREAWQVWQAAVGGQRRPDPHQTPTPAPNTIASRFGLGPCLECTVSLNGLGRPVKSIKWQLPNGDFAKRDFMAYHITWVAANGPIPDPQLSYSHLCHNGLCVEPKHGLWETLADNSARNVCRANSHATLPNGAVLTICPHNPACCSGRSAGWDDPMFAFPPSGGV